MIISIADQPGTNSNVESLIEAYKKKGNEIVCGVRNFFYSNFAPDILHIQWPEKLYTWYPFTALDDAEKLRSVQERLQFYKNGGAVIIHTIHNIQPHIPEKLDFERKIFELIINYSDILSHYCSKSVEILRENFPGSSAKINIVNPRGDYLLDYRFIPKVEARAKLGIPENKFVILNFGNQIKYKNSSFLESVFKKLPVKEKFLLTAGNYRLSGYSKPLMVYHMVKSRLRMKIKSSKKKYFYKIIPPNDLPYFVNAADMFFLSHSGTSLNSGILPLAATFAKPVVFPDLGCFKQQMNNWVFESYKAGDEKEAVESVKKIYKKIISDPAEQFDNSLWLKENSWESHAERILSSVKELKLKTPALH